MDNSEGGTGNRGGQLNQRRAWQVQSICGTRGVRTQPPFSESGMQLRQLTRSHAAAGAHTPLFVPSFFVGILASWPPQRGVSRSQLLMLTIFPAKLSPAQGQICHVSVLRVRSTSIIMEYVPIWCFQVPPTPQCGAASAKWLSSSDNCGCFSVSFVMPHCLLALLLPLRVHHTCLRLHCFYQQAAQRLRHG